MFPSFFSSSSRKSFWSLNDFTKNTSLHSSDTSGTFPHLFPFVSEFFKISQFFRFQHAQHVQPFLQSRFWFAIRLSWNSPESFLMWVLVVEKILEFPNVWANFSQFLKTSGQRRQKKCFLQAGQLACRRSVIALKLAAESCSARCMQLCSLSPPSSTSYFSLSPECPKSSNFLVNFRR